VLLQPSSTDDGELKYDMRVIAHHVEYYMLARDSLEANNSNNETEGALGTVAEEQDGTRTDHNLGDSLWVFDGKSVSLWPDAGQLLASAAQDVGQELQAPITLPLDFYPLSVLLEKGILFGVEAELLQRRDASFALFRIVARVYPSFSSNAPQLPILTLLVDRPLPTLDPPALPIHIRHALRLLFLDPLPIPLLLLPRPRDPPPQRPRRDRRRPNLLSQPPPYSPLLPLRLPNPLPLHHCAMCAQDRASILAHPVRLLASATRVVRGKPQSRRSQNGGRIFVGAAQLERDGEHESAGD